MAFDGYMVSGSCVSERDYLLKTLCPSIKPDFTFFRIQSGPLYGGLGTYSCMTASATATANIASFNCNYTSSVSSLTDDQQIQAVNQILPYALAFLASIWAMKKIFQVLWNSSISFSSKKEQE